MDVALVTCLDLPEPDVDEDLLVAALTSRDIETAVMAWDDPAADWSVPRLAVVRSTWNYHHHLGRFRSWVDRFETAPPGAAILTNSAQALRWNAHKRYLVDLDTAGIPIVPTLWLECGSAVTSARRAAIRDAGWPRVVIKPAVSGGSFATSLVDAADDDALGAALGMVRDERDALVQPYVEGIEEHGERSIVCIDGVPRHAVRKSPRFHGDSERVSSGVVPIDSDERRMALHVLATAAHWSGEAAPLYARVDLARGDHGRPMLMELELIEPSLFLLQSPATLELFADAIAARLKAVGR